MTLSFTCIADLKCRVGESPVYDERTNLLFFVDIPERRLYEMSVGDGALRSWVFDSEVCSLGLAASGRLVVALRDEVILFDRQTELRTRLATIEADTPETRLNDGKVGPDGAFWVGGMDDRPSKEPIASLYRVDGAGNVERKVEGLIVSNGLAWTADGETMFHSDARGPWIDRWDFDRWKGDDLQSPPAGRPRRCGGASGRRRLRRGGMLLERRRVGRKAQPLRAGRPPFGNAPIACARADHALFRRAGFPHDFPDEPSRWALRGVARAKRRNPADFFAAPSPVAGFPAWRFLDV